MLSFRLSTPGHKGLAGSVENAHSPILFGEVCSLADQLFTPGYIGLAGVHYCEGDGNMVRVILPELSEGIKSATVSYWYFSEGQKVAEKEPLVELTTDKAAFNLPSPATGSLTEIFFKEGDTINVGDIIAVIDDKA